jgi:hypothetical protein
MIASAAKVMYLESRDILWRHAGFRSGNTQKESDPMALELELEKFRRLLPDLLVRDEGKFALIIGNDLIGTYQSRSDALREGYQRATVGPFLVQIISRDEPILRFSRDVQGKWSTSQPPTSHPGRSFQS